MAAKKEAKTSAKKENSGEQSVVNIGMVGHVDHGKTSLTQQLTGKWTDTHSEELKRGISIRLGYADTTFYKCPKCKDFEKYTSKEICPKCSSKAEKIRKVSFVDAPGHETLMTTMLSGAALMHGAILVIAANEECPQPRTREHLTALKISEIENIIVAQNKVDLVSKEDAEKNYKQIKKFLETEGYEDVPIIPISANFGGNIDLLIEAIEKVIKTPEFKENLPLKMYCARSFDINKPGTKPGELKGGVIGGAIMQGMIKPNDEIEITPGFESGKMSTKVVSVSAENGLLKDAKEGGLIAIGTLLDPSVTQNDRMRGQVIAKTGTVPEPTKDITLEVHFFERLIEKVDQEIKIGDLLVLTVGTLTAVGNVTNKKKDDIDMKLKNSVIIEKNQKVAISKRDKTFWRLVAYGISK
ncbi:MAG: translation initiation factor IF-2 subunit gamma [Candidatus Diapherotrites archaeon]